MSCITNRWPPVYDFESLQDQIKNLINRGLDTGFYKETFDSTSFFQGDIIQLEVDYPFIDEDGNIAAYETSNWLILGNTCDLSREDLMYTNLIPIEELDEDIPENILLNLKHFQNYKKIYFPDHTKKSKGFIADFTQVCSINKEFLVENASKITELEYHSWVLFHSCIVRYFARDDGRHD